MSRSAEHTDFGGKIRRSSFVVRRSWWVFGVLLILCGEVIAQGNEESRVQMAGEMEEVLDRMMEVWYPRTVDRENGGFWSDFTYDWQREGEQHKFIVTQARHLWTLSRAVERYPADTLYPALAHHGFVHLRDVMWDAEEGGFFQLLRRDGTVLPDAQGNIVKTAYGNAFGIYALAAYTRATGDSAGLAFAQQAFRWLDEHSHDPELGGFFQFMERDGTPMPDGYNGTPPKDQNSSIHLLEAFTELYPVWQDPVVRDRLSEMLLLIRDTIVTERGALTLFSRADWTPVSYRDSAAAVREANYRFDHISFGHDVETAFLLREAAHVLGEEDDPRTLDVTKRMVDHALRTGWDEDAGGFYDEGYVFAGVDTMAIIRDTKTWWAQAEALNTLLLMADAYPEDELEYFDRLQTMWGYTKEYLIDDEHGGWYDSGLDHAPQARTRRKAGIWKGNYHTYRSLARCIDRLKTAP